MAFTPLLIEGLTPEMEKIAEMELGETPLVKKESLKKIKELIEAEADFHPFMDDKFLLMFLRCKKHDVQKAFKTLRNFYLFKQKYSGIYSDLLPSDVKKVMDMNCYTQLSFRDPNGSLVAIFRLGACNWEEASVNDIMATSFIFSYVTCALEASSVCGCVGIFDFKDFSSEKLFKFISPKFVIFLIRNLENCFPVRIKGLHVVNEPGLFQIFYNIIKFFLPKKLEERVFLHGNNLEGLHKYIPPEILPEELGGKTGPMDSTELFDFCLRLEPVLKEMNKCGFTKRI